jgi:hypothetical protein
VTEQDKTAEELAAFRGIPYEEAKTQLDEDKNILTAEALMCGREDDVPAGPAPLFEEFRENPLVGLMKNFALHGILKSTGIRTIHAENGKLLSPPRMSTPEEDEQFLIDETERKMTEPADLYVAKVNEVQLDLQKKLKDSLKVLAAHLKK